MGGSALIPELLVQRLHAVPRDGAGDHHADLRGVVEETRAWALEQAAAAGLDPVSWRLTLELVERWTVDPAEVASLPVAPNAKPDPDPVFEALAVAGEQQTFLHRAEFRRVRAAVAAWRLAQAVEGEGASDTHYLIGFFQDLGLTLGVAGSTAKNMVHAAYRIEQSLPQVWAVFRDARVPWRAMQAVHAAIDGLHDEVLPAFDEQAVTVLDETPTVLLKDALRRLAERLQASTADDRHDAAMRRRSVTVEAARDGMGWLHAYLPMTAVKAIDHQLQKAAIHERQRSKDAGGIGVLRADILQDGLIDALAKDSTRPDALVPARRGIQPKIGILIPAMTALGHSDVPPILQGYGPIGIRTALKLAGEAKSWIRVLTDPFTGAVVNIGRTRYRPTSDMRTLLRLLDGGGEALGARETRTTPRSITTGPSGCMANRATPRSTTSCCCPTSTTAPKTAGETDVGMLKDRTAIFTTASGNRYVTRPHDPPEPTPVPLDVIDEGDCPF